VTDDDGSPVHGNVKSPDEWQVARITEVFLQ